MSAEATSPRALGAPAAAASAAVEPLVRRDPTARAERAARPVVGDRGVGHDERADAASRPSPAAVPTRTSRRAPSATSSATTAAALGPPRPVLWIVNGAPSAAGPL